MLDAVVTYAIVAVATAFVIWRVVLPAGVRAGLGARLRRAAGEDCVSKAPQSGCPGGCAGCAVAKPAQRKRA